MLASAAEALLFLLHNINAPAPSNASTTIPATAPPAMAPLLFFFGEAVTEVLATIDERIGWLVDAATSVPLGVDTAVFVVAGLSRVASPFASI